MTLRVEWVPYGRPAADRLRLLISEAKARRAAGAGHGRRAVQPRRRRHPAAPGLRGARARVRQGAGLAAVTFLTPYRLAELLGAARARRPPGGGRCPPRCSPPPCGPCWPSRPGRVRAGRRAPGHRVRARRHLPRAARPLPGRPRRRWPPPAPGPARSSASTGPPGPASSRALVRRGGPARRGRRRRSTGRRTLDLGAVVVYLPQRLSRHAAGCCAAAGRARAVTVRRRHHRRSPGRRRGRASARPPAAVRRAVGAAAAPSRRPVVDADAHPVRHRLRRRRRGPGRGAGRRRRRAGPARRSTASPSSTPSPEPYARLAHEHLARRRHRHQRRRRRPARRPGGRPHPPRASRPARRRASAARTCSPGWRRRPSSTSGRCAPDHRLGAAVPGGGGRRRARPTGTGSSPAWPTSATRAADEADAEPDDARRGRPSAAAADAGRAREPARVRARPDRRPRRAPPPAPAAGASTPPGPAACSPAPRRRRRGATAGRAAERKAAERVELALDRLGALDAVEGPVALDVFARTLAARARDRPRPGRPLRRGRARRLGRDGHRPRPRPRRRPRPGRGLVPRHRPRRLAPPRPRAAAPPAASSPLRADRVERQHRQLLAALAGARRQLLCVPRGDLRRSAERVPSRWVLDLASGRWPASRVVGRPTCSPADAAWVDHVAVLRRRAAHPGVPGHRPGAPAPRRCWPPAATSPPTDDAAHRPPGAEVIAARRSRRFTRFDGNLAGLAVPSPGRPHHLAHPPRALGRLPARLPRRGPPRASRRSRTPRTRCRSRRSTRATSSTRRSSGSSSRCSPARRPSSPGPAEPWTAGRPRPAPARSARALCDEYEARGLTGRPIFWRRDRRRILADLDRFLARGRRAPRRAPAPARWPPSSPSGLDGGLDAGRRPAARRADRCASGARPTGSTSAPTAPLHVVDYKTGATDGYARPRRGRPRSPRGTQAPARRLRPGRPGRHRRRPTRRCAPSTGSSPTEGGFEPIGYDVTDEVLERRPPRSLGTIVDGHRGRRLPARTRPTLSTVVRASTATSATPTASASSSCAEHWERKRARPRARRATPTWPSRSTRRRPDAEPTRPTSPRRPPPRPTRRPATASPPTSTPRCSSRPAPGRARPPRSSTGRRPRRHAAPPSCGQIAAITFTEKAGAELRDRVRRRARGARRRRRTPTRREAERCRAALDQLDGAAIGTLHSFAQRLLSEHPVEAGLPPRVEVLDEVTSGVEFDRRWAAFLDELLDDPALERTSCCCFAAGVDPDGAALAGPRLRRALGPRRGAGARRRARAARRSRGLLAPAPRRPSTPSCAARPTASTRPTSCCAAPRRASPSTAARLATPSTTSSTCSTRSCGGRRRASRRASRSGSIGQQGQLGRRRRAAGAVAAAGEALAASRAEVARRLRPPPRRRHPPASPSTRPTSAAAAGHARVPRPARAGPARAARPRARRRRSGPRLHQRYRRLLLDEFQDTDPIQIELAVRIAAADPAPTPPAGAVGRRRRRPPAACSSSATPSSRSTGSAGPTSPCSSPAEARFGAGRRRRGRAHRQLPHRRRRSSTGSTPPSRALMAEAPDAELPSPSQPDYVAARRRAARRRPIGPPVAVLGRERPPGRHRAPTSCAPPRPPRWPPPSPRRSTEGWPVGDGDGDGWRPARLGDITILVPARTSLPFLEDALEAAGIPYRAESSSLVYATRAVRDLLMVLRAVDDPTDHLAHRRRPAHPAARLRRRRPVPLQGRAAAAAGATWPTSPTPSRRRPGARRACAYLRELHDERHWRSPVRAARPHRPRPPGPRARLRRGPAPRRVAPAAVRDRPGPGVERGHRRQPARSTSTGSTSRRPRAPGWPRRCCPRPTTTPCGS